ncbi:hypothetical protein SMD20_34080 [Nonomuraea sp. LP-02]|uniref:hypothetical protein n=1 Tax=Nonomuraea sp. LP-02 TaxID=3097960 RepID=UPI002E333279|nr:hypothetical protein [Nonomuraea sp. LP-02]MED7929317.1 hypothetical protein [Nonomuraea sp. LP-02]
MSDDLNKAEEALYAFMDLSGELKPDKFAMEHLLFVIKNADLMQYYLDNIDNIDDPEVRARAPRARSEGMESPQNSTPEPPEFHPGIPVEPALEYQGSALDPTRNTTPELMDSSRGVGQLVDLIRGGQKPTIGDVQRMFGKSHTTAQRWLAKAKRQAQADQPIPLRRRNG